LYKILDTQATYRYSQNKSIIMKFKFELLANMIECTVPLTAN